jgi:hypothetical protein
LYLYFYPIHPKLEIFSTTSTGGVGIPLKKRLTGEKRTGRVGGVLAVLKKPLLAIRGVSTLG